jgi:hypothetical protein
METAKDEDAVLANTLKGREAEYKASNKTWQSLKVRKALIHKGKETQRDL